MKTTQETKLQKSDNTGPKQDTKFKKGQSGNPKGRPLGSKNFTTDFDEVVEEIAKLNNISPSEARKILLKKAYLEAKEGSFPFYKDIQDRYYGKAPESIDITTGGKPFRPPIYAGLSRHNISEKDIRPKKENKGGERRNGGEQDC